MQYLYENANYSGHLPNDVLFAIQEFLPNISLWRLTLSSKKLLDDQEQAVVLEQRASYVPYAYGENYSLWIHQNRLYGAGWATGGAFGVPVNGAHLSKLTLLSQKNPLLSIKIHEILSSGKTSGLLSNKSALYVSGLIADHTRHRAPCDVCLKFVQVTPVPDLENYTVERLFKWPNNFLIQLTSRAQPNAAASVLYGTISVSKSETDKTKHYAIKQYALSLEHDELVAQTAWTDSRLFVLTNKGRILSQCRETGICFPKSKFHEHQERFYGLSGIGDRIFALSENHQLFVFEQPIKTIPYCSCKLWPIANLQPEEYIAQIQAYGHHLLLLTSQHRLLASGEFAKDTAQGLFGKPRGSFNACTAVPINLNGLTPDEAIERIDIEHEHAVVKIKNNANNRYRLGIFGKNSNNEQGITTPPQHIQDILPAPIYACVAEKNNLSASTESGSMNRMDAVVHQR